MPESFGARLRRTREEQQIALVTIAEQTKIKRSLLEALERDDVSQWPCGIYRRAYIRAYAQAINLNPDVVVREFLEAHPEPDEMVTTAALAAAAEIARTNGAPPTRFRNMVGSALGSLARLRRANGFDDAVAGVAPLPVRRSVVDEPVRPAADDPAPAAGGTVVEFLPMSEPAAPALDFGAVARLCTALGRADSPDAVQMLLQEAADVLDATGLIVWVWDDAADGLRPALAHGYPRKLLAQLPTVGRDDDNLTAAAFRTGALCAIGGSADASGALVVPLLAPLGCAGVLAIELRHGREQDEALRAAATIIAALLAPLTESSRAADVPPLDGMMVRPSGDFAAPIARMRAGR